MPGEHWIAIYVDDGGRYGEYFDLLGRQPTATFGEHCREWTFNCKQLQSITSRFCGHYCACCVFLEVEMSICIVFFAILIEILDLMVLSCMN